MRFHCHPALQCPLDGLPLNLQDGALRCDQQHSFDIARQGYVNLLGAADKRSRDPGDSKAMVAARGRFLQAGHYAPIAGALYELLAPNLAEQSLIVDAGCGEGYYLAQLRAALAASGTHNAHYLGFDISKWAVQAAARRFPGSWIVASNRNIPLADASSDVLLDMFGFADFESFARVLKPGGLLLRVQTGARHLLALREIIYRKVNKPAPAPEPSPGFSLLDTRQIEFTLASLDRAALADLLLMTPHFFRASITGRETLSGLDSLSTDVDVCFSLLRRD